MTTNVNGRDRNLGGYGGAQVTVTGQITMKVNSRPASARQRAIAGLEQFVRHCFNKKKERLAVSREMANRS